MGEEWEPPDFFDWSKASEKTKKEFARRTGHGGDLSKEFLSVFKRTYGNTVAKRHLSILRRAIPQIQKELREKNQALTLTEVETFRQMLRSSADSFKGGGEAGGARLLPELSDTLAQKLRRSDVFEKIGSVLVKIL